MSTRTKVLIAVAVLLGGPPLIAGMLAGGKRQEPSPPVAASSEPPKPVASKPPSKKPAPVPAPAEPTWAYPGDPHCTITYRDRGDGSTTWTAAVTVGGQLKTHAGAADGTLYAHDTAVTAGRNAFAAPVPLTHITDIAGVLYTQGKSYACSVAPQLK